MTNMKWMLRMVELLRRKGERTENPKNCPFCGKKAILKELVGWFVVCANERCRLYGPDRPDSQSAIAAWNRIVVR